MVSEVSNFETSVWQLWSIVHSNSGVECKSCGSNAILLVTIECRMSCDTINFVKLILFKSVGTKEMTKLHSFLALSTISQRKRHNEMCKSSNMHS